EPPRRGGEDDAEEVVRVPHDQRVLRLVLNRLLKMLDGLWAAVREEERDTETVVRAGVIGLEPDHRLELDDRLGAMQRATRVNAAEVVVRHPVTGIPCDGRAIERLRVGV